MSHIPPQSSRCPEAATLHPRDGMAARSARGGTISPRGGARRVVPIGGRVIVEMIGKVSPCGADMAYLKDGEV
jgi:hypothetical protein